MKPVRVVAIVATLVTSTCVLAEGNFEGPWVGAGMGFRGQNTKITDRIGNELDGLGKDSLFGIVQGGYGFRYGDFNLGPYAFYLIGNTDSNDVSRLGLSASTRWKNQWGVGLQPGYFLTRDTVLYLKAGFNQTTLEVNAANSLGSINKQDQFSGPGIGLGMKTELRNHLIIFVDAQQQYYRSNTYDRGPFSVEIKPKMTLGTFGFGYQFQ